MWICQVFTLEKDHRIAGGVAFVDAFCLTKETGEIEVTLREQTVFNLFFQTSGGFMVVTICNNHRLCIESLY